MNTMTDETWIKQMDLGTGADNDFNYIAAKQYREDGCFNADEFLDHAERVANAHGICIVRDASFNSIDFFREIFKEVSNNI